MSDCLCMCVQFTYFRSCVCVCVCAQFHSVLCAGHIKFNFDRIAFDLALILFFVWKRNSSTRCDEQEQNGKEIGKIYVKLTTALCVWVWCGCVYVGLCVLCMYKWECLCVFVIPILSSSRNKE